MRGKSNEIFKIALFPNIWYNHTILVRKARNKMSQASNVISSKNRLDEDFWWSDIKMYLPDFYLSLILSLKGHPYSVKQILTLPLSIRSDEARKKNDSPFGWEPLKLLFVSWSTGFCRFLGLLRSLAPWLVLGLLGRLGWEPRAFFSDLVTGFFIL